METASSSCKRDATHTETEAASAASSSKRARVGTDRLGDLPDCLLHDILSLLGSRQAVQTSALSRRWRHLWRSVPCVDIDQREFRASVAPPVPAPLLDDDSEWESFEDFADNMLSSLPGTAPAPLDAFRLHLLDQCRYTTISRWVRRGIRRRPAVVDIHGYGCNIFWPTSSRLGSDTCRVTRLRLVGVALRRGFGEQLGDQCPVLEDMYIENCTYSFRTIASPTLKSLALVFAQWSYGHLPLVLAAPRLASLCLVLPFGSTHGYPVTVDPENGVLASLVKASICITDKDDEAQRNIRVRKRKLEYLKSMCNFLACLPNVRNLDLSGFTTTALLDEESKEFPVFHNLGTLILDDCDVGMSSQALMSILQNTPNLEKLGLRLCKFLDRPKRRRGKAGSKRASSKCRSSTPLRCKNLKSIEIKYEENDKAHLEKVFSQISKGTQEEMWLTQWQRVKKLRNVGPTTVQLFRTERTKSIQS